MLRLQVTRCDPVPVKGREGEVQTGFWGAVGGRSLMGEPHGAGATPGPNLTQGALRSGTFRAGPGEPVLLQWPPGGSRQGGHGAGRGGCSRRCRAPLPCAGGHCRAGPSPARLQTLCPGLLPSASSVASPTRSASSEAQLFPGRFPNWPQNPKPPPTQIFNTWPQRTCKAAGSRPADPPWVRGGFANAQP